MWAHTYVPPYSTGFSAQLNLPTPFFLAEFHRPHFSKPLLSPFFLTDFHRPHFLDRKLNKIVSSDTKKAFLYCFFFLISGLFSQTFGHLSKTPPFLLSWPPPVFGPSDSPPPFSVSRPPPLFRVGPHTRTKCWKWENGPLYGSRKIGVDNQYFIIVYIIIRRTPHRL